MSLPEIWFLQPRNCNRLLITQQIRKEAGVPILNNDLHTRVGVQLELRARVFNAVGKMYGEQ